MKIIYLANVRIPTEKAHGIQIAKMCEAFASAGVEVELVVPARINSIRQDLFDYYGVKRIFKVKKLPCLDLIFLKIPKIGFWLESISFAFFAFLYLVFSGADIIYSRDLPILFPFVLFKKKLILELHYLPKHFFLYKPIFKKAKAVVVLTKLLKFGFYASIGEKEININKILVEPDVMDMGKFDISDSKEDCRRKSDLHPSKNIVLYAGSLYQWKGVYTLAEAASLLDDNTLVIFVGGPAEELKKFKAKAKLADNVLILGEKPYLDIPYYLKAADVLVLPNSGKSKISREWTSPLKMFEYMASQRPIVASDLPSIRETLNDKNALFFQPDNPKDLAGKINQLLANDSLSEKIARQAYEDVKNYTWDKRAERIINFIK